MMTTTLNILKVSTKSIKICNWKYLGQKLYYQSSRRNLCEALRFYSKKGPDCDDKPILIEQIKCDSDDDWEICTRPKCTDLNDPCCTLAERKPKPEPAIDIPKLKQDYTNPNVLDDNVSCRSTYRLFTVQLSINLHPFEYVGLTGSSISLGEWQLARAVPLRPFKNFQWSANVLLPQCHDVKYRYFTYVLDAQGNKLVRRWETQLQARSVKQFPLDARTVDRFGEIVPGEIATQRGWLTNETIVQLKFEREKLFQVIEVDKFDPELVLIKVVPLHADDLDSVVPDEEGVTIEVSKFQYGECQLQPQQSFGVPYKNGDVVIFHLTIPRSGGSYAFALTFHNKKEEPIGQAILTANHLMGSEGILELEITEPIKNSCKVVAMLTLPYMVVQPFVEVTQDFFSTFANYWPKDWPVLDVGHRGNGKSYIANPPKERENTIASFMRAYESKADLIELDVHLTSDGVPVIWHDFAVKTAPHGKNITGADQLEAVLIKDLSYGALKDLRVFAVVNDKPIEYPAHNAEPVFEQRIFPTLVDVFKALPRSLGIDIEIKWPQSTACGGVEAKQSLDKNFFVDRVLENVFNNGLGRPLIFSSFDADICVMLRFKQNLLPVMFLSQGETKKWRPFMDLRTRNFEQAVNMAQAFDLIGTAPHAEDFLGENGEKLINMARSLGQIVVIWGDDCNSRERIEYLTKIGATAICYDRSDLNTAADKKSNFFRIEDLQEITEQQLRKNATIKSF